MDMFVDNVEVSYLGSTNYSGGNKTFTDKLQIADHNGASEFNGLLAWFAYYNADIGSTRRAANHAFGNLFDGIRGTISGSNLLLRDPADDAPTTSTGTKFGDAVYQARVVYRGEYQPSGETYLPVAMTEHHIPASVFSNCSQEDGSDVVLTTTDGTELPAEFKAFSKSGQTCQIYVQLAALVANTDQTILWQCGGSANSRVKTAADVWKLCYGGTVSHRLVAHMESESSTEPDVSGNGRAGTVTNVTRGVSSQVQNGMDNPNNAAGRIEWDHEIIGSGAITYRTWIRQDTWGASNVGRICSNGKFLILNDGTGAFNVQSDGTGVSKSASSGVLGLWQQLIVLRKADGKATVYVDGKISGAEFSTAAPVAGSTNLFLMNQSALNRHFDGGQDEIAIPDVILTADQIATHYYNKRAYEVNGAWDFGEAVEIPADAGGNQKGEFGSYRLRAFPGAFQKKASSRRAYQ